MRVYLLIAAIGCCAAEYCPRTPCSKEDPRCLEVLFNGILYDITRGIPEFDIQPSDPLNIDINGIFSTLCFQANNNTIVGLNEIVVTDVLVSADLAMMSMTLVSPRLNISSDFSMDGYMINLPVGGKGKAENSWGLQKVIIYTSITLINGTDGKNYMQFGNYSLDVSIEGTYTVNIVDIFIDDATISKYLNETEESTKDKDMSKGSDDASENKQGGEDCECEDNEDEKKKELIKLYNEFAAKNSKKISFFSRDALWYPIITAILTNMNKYLARYPQDKIVN